MTNATRTLLNPRIVSVGDNVVDIYSDHGVTFPGGNCVNVAAFAGQAGARSTYVGRIGRDDAGDLIHKALVAESVDTRFVERLDGPTAYCVVRHVNGDRVFDHADLGVSRFEPSSDEFAVIDRAAAVHVSASSGMDLHISRFAREALLSYDFSTGRDDDHMERICPHTYLASFSGGSLNEREVEDLAATAIAAGANWTLVTRGARGAVLARGPRRWSVPAHAVDVVDTLGAGDSFIARLLVGLLRNEPPDRSLSDASLAASRTCLEFGAFGHGSQLKHTKLDNHQTTRTRGTTDD